MSEPRVGYATGVFDLFHIGHLNLLRRARERCDRLVVGVTADELVSYKGKQAVIPLEERMEIVSAIRYVDEVVVQDDLDKLVAWRRIHYDLLFVGDDWKGSDRWLAYEARLRPLGVEVVYLPYTETTNSTKLRLVLDELTAPSRARERE